MPSERDQASKNDEGVNVRELVARTGPLPLVDAMNYTFEIAEVLASQHNAVQRDIDPSRVLITPEGTAKLFGTGLARPYQLSALVAGCVQ